MKSLADVTSEYRAHAARLDFVRLLVCRAQAGTPADAVDLFCKKWPTSLHRDLVVQMKAAVAPGTTTGTDWAGPLVNPAPLEDAFLQIVHTASLLGRIPGLVKVPFQTKVPIQTASGSYYWVGEASLKPLTKLAFSTAITLAATKCQGLIVVSRELGLLSAPGTEAALQQALVSGLTAFTDKQFLDPAVAAVAGKNPASITNGVAATPAGATLDESVSAVLAALFTARPGATGAVLLATPATIAKLAASGKNPDAKVNGGTVQGVPILSTEGAGATIIAADPSGIVTADGGVQIDIDRHGLVQLDDAPVGTAAAAPTSLWQANLVGFRCERFVNWGVVGGAAQYVTVA